jgi:phosphoglycolate phosphatase
VSNIITKEKMIEYIMQQENANDKNKVVMIGDRNTDIFAAKEIGIKSIGVLYGFGTTTEIEKCAPTHIATNVQHLSEIIHQYI